MWIEEDAFYPGSYFKETFNVHPEWNVASGVAQVFFFLSSFLCVFLILDALGQTKQRILGVPAFLEALASLYTVILKSNNLLIHPHPRR